MGVMWADEAAALCTCMRLVRRQGLSRQNFLPRCVKAEPGFMTSSAELWVHT